MKKKLKKVFQVNRLLFLCISSILLTACKEQPEVYLESYISSENCETQVHHEDDSTTENGGTETVTDGKSVEIEMMIETDIEPVALLYVYVCGAVSCPDVYALPEGSRICDAIDMAGGLREDAEALSVNLAQLVYDGQMLRIYTKEEVLAGFHTVDAEIADQQAVDGDYSVTETDDRININTASRSQLMTLPGIGSAKADAILSYRTKQGAFDKIEDLMKIPGIKEGIFEQIKEQISVD